ncbi:MAG TPA: hypothetical protein VH601_20275 [Bryobacteraceae bacterium]|jgi:hypothetical protein
MAACENKNPNRSPGPTSPKGKARSSRNALKHGLCSQQLLLPNEDAAEWEEVKEKWLSDCLFDEPLLITLAEQVAVAEWFHRRALREYNHARQHLHQQQPDFLFWTPEQIKLIERYQRYLTTRERAFNRAAANYLQFYKECRRAHEEANKLREKIYEMVKRDPDLNADLVETAQDFVHFPQRYVAKVLLSHPLCPEPPREKPL